MDDDRNNKRPKTYKSFLEPDAQTAATAASRQTFLRWQKISQQCSSTPDDVNRLQTDEAESDSESPVEAVHDPTPPAAEASSNLEYHSNESLIQSTDISEENSRNESIHENTVSGRSLNVSEQDADDMPMDIEDINDALNVAQPEDPHDIPNDIVMFEAAGLTVNEVVTMAQALSLRFYMSDEAKTALLELIKVLAGPRFEHLNTSKYAMSQRFNPPDDKISYTFYCNKCCRTLLGPVDKRGIHGNQLQLCESCDEEYQLTASSLNCFLSVDMECQIRSILENPCIQPTVIENCRAISERMLNNQDNISDVHDGQVYKKIVQERSLQNELVLTFNFNTDGASWFQSSSKSGWPIQLICNELPLKIRFKTLILAGLWIAEREPNPQLMNLYMGIFVAQAQKLMESGIEIESLTGEKLSFNILFLFASVDSVARPIIQNRLQFNGYVGCSWCYAHGEYFERAMRYPITDIDPDIRTHNEYLTDIADVERLCRNIRGVKGDSVLTTLPNFDCVWGFPFEYMHAVLLGVTRQLWELWLKPGKPWYLEPYEQTAIDRRLLNIQPPQEIHRLPRSSKKRAKWKASEWRSWLLYYSIPCLTGILRQDVLKSFSLFVRSIHKLLSVNITEIDLVQSEIDLITFVGECQVIYGKGAMTFNVHSLLHVVQSVRKSGPLWTTSAFPFESGIYNLKRNIHGPKGINAQIINSTLQMNMFQSHIATLPENSLCTVYCKHLFSGNRVSSVSRICNDILLIGKSVGTENITLSVNGDMVDVIGESYTKCIYKSTVLHSKRYKKARKTNDTIVQLQCGSIAKILQFIVAEGVCYIEYNKVVTQPVHVQEIEIAHLHQILGYEECSQIISISEIESKAIIVDVIENSYVSTLPNGFEVQ